jgi:hypothetical protein
VLVDKQNDDDRWSEPQGSDDLGAAPVLPPGSAIGISRFDDGITIRVPPAGLWRGSRGLFLFALFWNVFVLLLSIVMTSAWLAAADEDGEWWVLPLVLSIFWAVGIGVLLAAINMGRREAGLAVAGGTLMVMQTGLLGTKQREWALADVAAIQVGPSGMKVNGVPVMELQIHDNHGGRMGLLAGRSDEELAWLAYELSQAARVPK